MEKSNSHFLKSLRPHAKKLALGFTLLEILVVIGIASLVITIGTFSYTQSNKNSRDTTRKTDLQTISQALELYRSNNTYSSYPADLTSLQSEGYLSVVPQDPLTKTAYTYTPTCSTIGSTTICTTYVLSADIESSMIDYAIGPYGETTPGPKQNPTTAPTNTLAPTSAPTSAPTATPTPQQTSCSSQCQQAGYSSSSCRENCGGQYQFQVGTCLSGQKCCCGN